MYDKIEIPLPAHIPFRPGISEIRDMLRSPQSAAIVKHSKTPYYQAVVDLREHGLDAVLHLGSRMGKQKGKHKLELLDTGEKGYDEILELISGVIEDSPLHQKISRLDTCVDVDGIGVDWFYRSMRANHKQWMAMFGKIEPEYSEMGKRRLQTIYAGKRPNCFRCYDKTAELLAQQYGKARRLHKRQLRDRFYNELANGPRDAVPVPADVMARLEADFPFPSFEQMYGIPENHVRTRLERQMAAGKVPRLVNKVYKLLDGAEFNPFEKITFNGGGALLVERDGFSPVEWLAGVKMWELLESGEMGYQELRNLLNRDRNGARYERKFAPFLDRAASGERSITSADLFERYRASIARQLAA